MRKSPFTEELTVAALREADATSVTATARKHKVSEQTVYAWRKPLLRARPAPSDVKRLRALEAENALQAPSCQARSRHLGAQGDQRKKW